MDRAALREWVDAYERAWRTAGTDSLTALFASGATYRTAPFEEPFEGLPAIAAFWDAEREGPDEVFEMSSEVVAVEGDTGVVRVEVTYDPPGGRTYRDLWIVRFGGDNRCIAFEEWPFWPKDSGGGYVTGPDPAAS